MGLFDRWGRGREAPPGAAFDPGMPPGANGVAASDEHAIARYRYMLRTAPPETIEQAHAEAFAQLTPEQRRTVFDSLAREMPEAERSAATREGVSAESLARAATRAEIRRPGVMERVFGSIGAPAAAAAYGQPAGTGIGGLFAGTLLSSMAGTVLGSMIAQHFFTHHPQASQLLGGDGRAFDDAPGLAPADDSAGGVRDPFADAPTDAELGNDDPGILTNGDGDFGGFDDGGTFDV